MSYSSNLINNNNTGVRQMIRVLVMRFRLQKAYVLECYNKKQACSDLQYVAQDRFSEFCHFCAQPALWDFNKIIPPKTDILLVDTR